ncbi:MAG: SUMF1/EgtB/PvdO family nonheme iron enzyme [Anaerolineales bacterium]|nr:MAG: SUMF1/EgtB/PvdO family nonheme iron enzyme [Anaerolineales bacterium]
MKKNILQSIIVLFIAACQPAPAAMPALIPTSAPPSTPTSAPTKTHLPPVPQATSTPEAMRISPKDGMPQLWIPAGSFIMGGMDVQRKNDELPAHEIHLNAFWMDQVEVTNGMYALCVQAGSCRPPAQNRSDNREEYFGNPEFQDYPVVHVTWRDANVYCRWAGRRLPSEAEWERAARGNDKRNYPWGDELPNQYNSNSLNIVGDTTRVGSYAEGASPFGVLDMAGNVWEWVADRYRPDYYAKSPAENPTGPADDEVFNNLRVIRGGSFQEDGIFLRLSNRNSLEGPDARAQPTEDAYYGRSSVKVGFRCAADD